MPAAAVAKPVKTSWNFVVDFSAPADSKIFDGANYERFIRERVKVNGRTNNLAEASMTVVREGNKLVVNAGSPVSKRYFKYLTKKFLKKSQVRDWLRVVATDKATYTIKFFKVGEEEEEEEAEE